MYQDVRNFFPAGHKPASMVIGVSALAYPGLLVEINVRSVTDYRSLARRKVARSRFGSRLQTRNLPLLFQFLTIQLHDIGHGKETAIVTIATAWASMARPSAQIPVRR